MSATTGELSNQIIYAAFFFPLLLSIALITFVVIFVRRKHKHELERKNMLLKQQALIIEKQQIVERERNRIAAEMHDDLGAGLTRIKFLSERALKSAANTSEVQQISSIAEQSNRLVTNMSEIIWAMNSRFDNAESLIGYLRRYASEYLDEHQINLTFSTPQLTAQIPVSAEKRRNVYLIIKEILHNTVKHADASGVIMTVHVDASELQITVTEKEARGFDLQSVQSTGNGIYNMQQRAQRIGGTIDFDKGKGDMSVTLRVPLGET